MADNAKKAKLTIPADTQKKFPKLIELIANSESMNNEERQYWVDALPKMKPAQRKSLEEILTNEKTQLAAIEAKYGKTLSEMGKDTVEQLSKKRSTKRKKRKEKESKAEEKERQAEEEILSQIEGS